MKAIIKEKKGVDNIVYKDVDIPEISEDEVLIKIKAAGICGTDIHIFYDEYPYWPPVILGHEFSGIVEKTGKNIKYFKAGDRVTSEPHQKVCGYCKYCRLGLIHLCSEKRSPGWGIDGAMTSYIKLPEKLLHKIPDNISFIEGAVIEPASTVAHAVIERGKIKPEDFTIVIGPGPIGLIAAQIARAAGAKKVIVCGTETDADFRLVVAGQLGFETVNVEKSDLKEFVLSKTNNLSADIIIECSGSENGINTAIDVLSKNGKLCAMGISGKEYMNIKWNGAIFKELEIAASLSSTYTSWNYVISMLEEGKLNLLKIVSHKFPLSQFREALKLAIDKQGLKIVLIPDEEWEK
ncbi:MAG: alcohol dehydrogenase catalytic domain-containing protein [Actinobacteria bacterium]|nr:alcohol dehydrogenase catalytic domain-containing protein [Actinomycetota bacterium]